MQTIFKEKINNVTLITNHPQKRQTRSLSADLKFNIHIFDGILIQKFLGDRVFGGHKSHNLSK